MFGWTKLRIKAVSESEADKVISILTKSDKTRNINYCSGYVTYEQYGVINDRHE